MVLVVRMRQDNTLVLDYHLIPRERLPKGNITFRRTAKGKLDNYRQTTLEAVAHVILRKVDVLRERRSWHVGTREHPRRTDESPRSGQS